MGDWYKFSLLAAITEATKNSSQSHCICFSRSVFKVNSL